VVLLAVDSSLENALVLLWLRNAMVDAVLEPLSLTMLL
jgi:hypothetical protein